VKRILEYKIISDDHLDTIQESVNDCLRQGWRPLGGIACSFSEYDEYYYALYAQSLVRYSDAPEKTVVLENTKNRESIHAELKWKEIE
jgi:hypothetical protein